MRHSKNHGPGPIIGKFINRIEPTCVLLRFAAFLTLDLFYQPPAFLLLALCLPKPIQICAVQEVIKLNRAIIG